MADEETQGSGTATVDSPGENTVQLTFLPEGKTVEFEHDKLPYKDHGKEQSILDIIGKWSVLTGRQSSIVTHITTRYTTSSRGRRFSVAMKP